MKLRLLKLEENKLGSKFVILLGEKRKFKKEKIVRGRKTFYTEEFF